MRSTDEECMGYSSIQASQGKGKLELFACVSRDTSMLERERSV